MNIALLVYLSGVLVGYVCVLIGGPTNDVKDSIDDELGMMFICTVFWFVGLPIYLYYKRWENK